MSAGSFDLEKLVRKNIWSLQPYRCARDDYSEGILLDANENSFGPPIDQRGFQELERYPCPYQLELKSKIAKLRGVEKENIFLGVGSDEAIDLIIRIFCIPSKESILTFPPTYGMYKVSAATNDVRVVNVPLTPSFQLDFPKIDKAIQENEDIKVIFVCTPNNPTANDIEQNDILTLIQKNPQKIIVIDEAYIDFSDNSSFSSYVKQYQNVIVLQTLSKSFGLAGIRLGMAISQSGIIEILNKVKAPYNINKMTAEFAHKVFEEEGISNMRKNVEKIKEEKKKLIQELEKISTVRKIHPSNANFLLFQIDNSYDLYKKIADAGVVVRYRGTEIHCNDCLRISIGKPEENLAFLDLLKKKISS